MEPFYYTRVAMVGWVFLAVTIGSLWASDVPEWQSLVGLFQSAGVLLACGLRDSAIHQEMISVWTQTLGQDYRKLAVDSK